MEINLNTNINLYPTPPKHYTKFIRENEMKPPDINFLNKVSSIMAFGREYKKNERNTSNVIVNTDFLKHFDVKLIETKNIPNKNLSNFHDDLLVEKLNIDIFDAIDCEIKFIGRIYKELLQQLTNLENFELNSCLIKFSFQKIYFFISILRKKKILIDVINYFDCEKKRNTELENTFIRNLQNCESMITSELSIIDDKS